MCYCMCVYVYTYKHMDIYLCISTLHDTKHNCSQLNSQCVDRVMQTFKCTSYHVHFLELEDK